MKDIKFEEVQSLLDSGKKLEDVFDRVTKEYYGFRVVCLNGKWNYIDSDSKLFSPNQWFDYCTSFQEDFGRVKLSDKGWNYIKIDGTYVSDIWFDWCGKFCNGFGVVKLDEAKYNYIDLNGEFLSTAPIFYGRDFHEGVACIYSNNGYNFINTKGEKIFKHYRKYDYFGDFYNGYAEINVRNKLNFISKDGKLLLKKWIHFDDCFGFENDDDKNFCIVGVDNKWNILDRNGEWISKIWVDDVANREKDNFIVEINGYEYKLDFKGKLDKVE